MTNDNSRNSTFGRLFGSSDRPTLGARGEHNLFQEVQDDLERQRYEALWKRYGGLVVALAVAVILATAGMSFWRSQQAEASRKATDGFLTASSVADPAKEITALQAFAAQHGGTAPASLAELQVAALLAKQGETAKARQAYDRLADNAAIDVAFRQMATLMSVRLQLDMGDASVLQQRLQPLLADKAPWRVTALETSGYLYWRAGDKAKAKEVFTALAADSAAPPTAAGRANDMLRLLAE